MCVGGKAKMNTNEKIKLEYEKWNKVKIHLQLYGRQPNPKQGEIWWAGCGKNLGTEMNGKNTRFARPVIIYRKLSRYSFMAVPLTSKKREGSWYVPFVHKGIKEVAVVGQAKVMSVRRLYSRMGEMDQTDMGRVEKAFAKLYT